MPTPTRSGHNFDGWYTEETGGTQITTATEVTTDASTQTLYARWISRLLADYVKIGDYVNYEIDYENVATNSAGEYTPDFGYTGWRVIAVDTSTKVVKLVTAGIPLTYDHPIATGSGATSVTNLTEKFFKTPLTKTTTSTDNTYHRCGFDVSDMEELAELFKANKFTETSSYDSDEPAVQAMTKDDLDKAWIALDEENHTTTKNGTEVFDEQNDSGLFAIKSGTSYAAYHLATAMESKYLWCVRYYGAIIYSSSEYGIRPVVTLKATTETDIDNITSTTGQSSNKWELK